MILPLAHCTGLYFCLDSGYREPMKLDSVRAHATVRELAAHVKITQAFTNHSSTAQDGQYEFPVPASASVYDFAFIKQDGTRVVAIVAGKEEARQIHDEAKSQGKRTALMAQATPDVFHLSLGNIAANEQVQVEISYVTLLGTDEENDSFRLQIPHHISERYGHGDPSEAIASASPAIGATKAFLEVEISIEGTCPIRKVTSPSHTVETELGPDPSLPNAASLPFANYMRVSLSSRAPLNKDFVLSVTSQSGDAPRAIAESSTSGDSMALALSLVPRAKLPDLAKSDFIFVIDRSGSMDESISSNPYGPLNPESSTRIGLAKMALNVLLRSLPRQHAHFNIVSFGSSHSALWAKGPKPYSQATLDEATRHVDKMSANFGGTELQGALSYIIKTRAKDRPTNVILLTDGAIWGLDPLLAEVRKEVESASKQNPLRFFTLGIGHNASTALCDGIAEASNGTSQYVVQSEKFAGKCARLLKGARTPPFSSLSVDWNDGAPPTYSDSTASEDDFEMVDAKSNGQTAAGSAPPPTKLSVFDMDVDPLRADDAEEVLPLVQPVKLPPMERVQSTVIRSFFSGTRLYAFAILTQKAGTVVAPRFVTLRGRFFHDGTEHDFELEVPVGQSALAVEAERPMQSYGPLHALAAKKLIDDITAGTRTVASLDGSRPEAVAKAAITRLGTRYSVASQHTSFVAVDEAVLSAREVGVRRVPPNEIAIMTYPRPELDTCRMPAPDGAPGGALFGSAAPARKGFCGRSRAAAAPAPQAAPSLSFGGPPGGGVVFGSACRQASSIPLPPPPPCMSVAPPAPMARRSAAPPAANSAFSFSLGSARGGGGMQQKEEKKKKMSSIFASKPAAVPASVDVDESATDGMRFEDMEAEQARPLDASSASLARLDALVRQQAFDGYFASFPADVFAALATRIQAGLSAALASLPSGPASEQTRKRIVLSIATVLALRADEQLRELEEAWEAIVAKVDEYMLEALSVEAEALPGLYEGVRKACFA